MVSSLWEWKPPCNGDSSTLLLEDSHFTHHHSVWSAILPLPCCRTVLQPLSWLSDYVLVFHSVPDLHSHKAVLEKSQLQASNVIFSLRKWRVGNHRCGRCELLCLFLYLTVRKATHLLLNIGQDSLEVISQIKPQSHNPLWWFTPSWARTTSSLCS